MKLDHSNDIGLPSRLCKAPLLVFGLSRCYHLCILTAIIRTDNFTSLLTEKVYESHSQPWKPQNSAYRIELLGCYLQNHFDDRILFDGLQYCRIVHCRRGMYKRGHRYRRRQISTGKWFKAKSKEHPGACYIEVPIVVTFRIECDPRTVKNKLKFADVHPYVAPRGLRFVPDR